MAQKKVGPVELAEIITNSIDNLEETLIVAEESISEVLSKANERKRMQKVHLVQTAKVIVEKFSGLEDESVKTKIIQRLKNDFYDFTSCCSGVSKYDLSTDE